MSHNLGHFGTKSIISEFPRPIFGIWMQTTKELMRNADQNTKSSFRIIKSNPEIRS